MSDFADFAVIAGGAAAALVGLLFVAVSIRADQVSRSIGLRSRIAGVLTILLSILIAWLCTTLPAAPRVLGLELLVTALLAGTAFIVLNIRAERTAESEHLAVVLDRLNPNVITTALIGAAGIALLFGIEGGLFLLAAATLIGFVGGVIGAWLVLLARSV